MARSHDGYGYDLMNIYWLTPSWRCLGRPASTGQIRDISYCLLSDAREDRCRWFPLLASWVMCRPGCWPGTTRHKISMGMFEGDGWRCELAVMLMIRRANATIAAKCIPCKYKSVLLSRYKSGGILYLASWNPTEGYLIWGLGVALAFRPWGRSTVLREPAICTRASWHAWHVPDSLFSFTLCQQLPQVPPSPWCIAALLRPPYAHKQSSLITMIFQLYILYNLTFRDAVQMHLNHVLTSVKTIRL